MENTVPQPGDSEEMTALNFGAVILPSNTYSTRVIVFPGTNCIPHWRTTGKFFITFRVYQGGKLLGKFHSPHCREDGYLEFDFDEFAGFFSESIEGIILAEFHHTAGIPVELYFSHTHRESGAYISYPSLPFTGDQLYPKVHSQQLENTLFWPGVPVNEHTQDRIAIVNPYNLSFLYQFSLYLPSGERVQTGVLKIPRYSLRWHDLEEIFPEHRATLFEQGERCTVCASAQFKLIAFNAIFSRESGIPTTIDHFHNYCLY